MKLIGGPFIPSATMARARAASRILPVDILRYEWLQIRA